MKGFDPAFLAELKAKNNIVDVIGGYTSLEKKGNNYWACCPFHHEKTPSFSVNASEQFYHCFGCGVSGDVIKFVQEIESVDFLEAVKILAERVKMPVPEADFDAEEIIKKRKHKETLLSIMLESAKFYRNNLYGSGADAHVGYLTDRSVQPSTIKKFGLGASLDFKSLPEYLMDKGFSREDLIDSGVAAEGKNSALYDFQAGRLIIPIINAFDEVIAFGGRLLEKKPHFAKYKNTRETVIFNKSRTLYNVNLLKKLKKTQNIGNVIMVEGYMDAITLYQAGFHNVVASMGTSLTQDQARLVKRYTDNVLISYDGDFAGQKANSRGMDIFKNEGLNVKVVPLPDGLDPDDVVRKLGADKYKECLSAAMPVVDYALRSLEKKYDLGDVQQKRDYVSGALKIIRNESEATVREELIGILSKKTGLSVGALKSDFSNLKSPPAAPKETKKEEKSPAWAAGIPPRVVGSMRFIVSAKLFEEDYAKDYKLKSGLFVNSVHIALADYINSCERDGKHIRISDVFDFVEENDKELNEIFDLYSDEKLLGADAENYFNDCVKTFEVYMIKEKMGSLAKKINDGCDGDEKKTLLGEMAELTLLLKKTEK